MLPAHPKDGLQFQAHVMERTVTSTSKDRIKRLSPSEDKKLVTVLRNRNQFQSPAAAGDKTQQLQPAVNQPQILHQAKKSEKEANLVHFSQLHIAEVQSTAQPDSPPLLNKKEFQLFEMNGISVAVPNAK
jgi:hypothetical protein